MTPNLIALFCSSLLTEFFSRFQLVVPLKWTTKHKPVCIHLAGTGDHVSVALGTCVLSRAAAISRVRLSTTCLCWIM